MQHVFLVGNITRDPELRVSSKGMEHLTLTIAVNMTEKQSDGEWKEKSYFWDAPFFGENAKRIARRNYQKGDKVEVSGRLRTNAFTRRDGTEGTGYTVQADSSFSIEKVGGRSGTGNYEAAVTEEATPEPEVVLDEVPF